MLDLTTLYVIILLNSIGFAILWAIISITYRSMEAARYWLAAMVMTCLSGPALLLGQGIQWIHLTGNLLVVLGFGLLWQGIRVFFNRGPDWFPLLVMLITCTIAMVLFGGEQSSKNLIFALGHAAPIIMALIVLFQVDRRKSGTMVVLVSCAILLTGVGTEALTNAMRLMGLMSDATYQSISALILVCTIVGGSFVNLGFLLMAVERLRVELHALASRDDLTGLPNRRALSERLILIDKRAKRLQQGVAILMMDLDRFKSINDTYGHPAGDAALVHVASVIKKNLREMDFLARFGGDEFCILMPDTDLKTARSLADILRNAVASTPFFWRSTQIPISAGIGLNYWEPSSGTTLTASLVGADEALIHIKRKSRYNMQFTADRLSARWSQISERSGTDHEVGELAPPDPQPALPRQHPL